MRGSIFPYKTSKYICYVILFRVPAPRPTQISDILPKLQNVSTTSNFLVKFALPSAGDLGGGNFNSGLRGFLRRKGINDRFISEDVGLLCSDAFLPGSALAAINTVGDYQGVIEKFAHTRNFTQINFDFYVDIEYKSMKFLEHWMEYIASGNDEGDASGNDYHFRMRYPYEYKSNDTRVVKFERDHNRFLEYRFIGLFPISINSVKVSYQGSQILKATATFSYDRYVCGESSSLARTLGKLFNNKNNNGVTVTQGGDSAVYGANTELNSMFKTNPEVINDKIPIQSSLTGFTYSTSGLQFDGLFIGEGRR